jgi:TRAP-type C4-dicarboxylate transport system substrate-binding protein
VRTRSISRPNGAISRRRLVASLAGAFLSRGAAAGAQPRFRYRLGLSQPWTSPNCIRLQEMAERVKADSDGDMEIAVHAGGALGSDDAMLAMLQGDALEMYLGGNVFGPLVPTMEMPGLPFTFTTAAAALAALDGELGDYLRAEMLFTT